MTSRESRPQVKRVICGPAVGRSMVARARRFFGDTEGAALIEYALLVLLMAALCIVLIQGIGAKVSNGFNSANAALP